MVSQARLASWPTAFGATFRFTTVCVCVSLCVCVSFAWELRAWDTRRWQPQYAARLPSPTPPPHPPGRAPLMQFPSDSNVDITDLRVWFFQLPQSNFYFLLLFFYFSSFFLLWPAIVADAIDSGRERGGGRSDSDCLSLVIISLISFF